MKCTEIKCSKTLKTRISKTMKIRFSRVPKSLKNMFFKVKSTFALKAWEAEGGHQHTALARISDHHGYAGAPLRVKVCWGWGGSNPPTPPLPLTPKVVLEGGLARAPFPPRPIIKGMLGGGITPIPLITRVCWAGGGYRTPRHPSSHQTRSFIYKHIYKKYSVRPLTRELC